MRLNVNHYVPFCLLSKFHAISREESPTVLVGHLHKPSQSTEISTCMSCLWNISGCSKALHVLNDHAIGPLVRRLNDREHV